jgi:hypothetical protein
MNYIYMTLITQMILNKFQNRKKKEKKIKNRILSNKKGIMICFDQTNIDSYKR